MIIHDLESNLFNHANLVNVLPDFIDNERDWESFKARFGSRELAIPSYIGEDNIEDYLTDKLYSYRKMWYNYNEMVERGFVTSVVTEAKTDVGNNKQGSYGDDGYLIDDSQFDKSNLTELESKSSQFTFNKARLDYVDQVFRDIVNVLCIKVF